MRLEGIGLGYRERAGYACDPTKSRGRLVAESESPTRTAFQRDRDRIIHSTAFRRLKHKTQVFIAHEGDHYRTRLTHTIEVAQIARVLARALQLDEDLAEAIALVHDFGHTPFGHIGENALNEKMKDWGGFDHNAQSLRIVTSLEKRYAEFDGLNLTWETLEGLIKHNGPLTGIHSNGHTVPQSILEYNTHHNLELSSCASLEAQCAAIADDIAYNAHDIDDGLRSGLLTLSILDEVPLIRTLLKCVRARYPFLDGVRTGHELVRRQITLMVDNVIVQSRKGLDALDPPSVEGVRAAGSLIVTFSPDLRAGEQILKRFLYENLYFHESILMIRCAANTMICNLFDAYMGDPRILPKEWQTDFEVCDEREKGRRVADFLSGMTDNYAIREHKRLFNHTPDIGLIEV